MAGVGVPQISAIDDCARVAHKKGIPIVADGGIKFSGDVVKALAAGASAVMIELDSSRGPRKLRARSSSIRGGATKYRGGWGSLGAMKRGSRDRYFQSEVAVDKLVPEGIEGRVPYKGTLAMNVHQLLGGLRSGMGYVGCRDLKELQRKARFVKITAAGLRESHVHDVIITQEAPNYRLE